MRNLLVVGFFAVSMIFSGVAPARAHYDFYYSLNHNGEHIAGGLLATGLSIWAFNAGKNSRRGARDFSYAMGTLFAFNAVWRFGGAH